LVFTDIAKRYSMPLGRRTLFLKFKKEQVCFTKGMDIKRDEKIVGEVVLPLKGVVTLNH